MSVESVRAYLEPFGVTDKIIEFDQSSATVELAARDLDVSLRRFDRVFPAAGSESSAIGLTLPELERCSASQGWVDVCKDWREETA